MSTDTRNDSSQAGSEAISREVDEFMLGYIDAMNRRDLDALEASLRYPYLSLEAETVVVRNVRADLDDQFLPAFQQVDALGINDVDVLSVTSWPLSTTSAISSIDYSRSGPNRSDEVTGRVVYVLHKDEAEGWQICAYGYVDPHMNGPDALPRRWTR